MRYDYTTVGHVTVDVLPGGERQPGGGAFYSAVQAARLGLRVLVITRGEPAELAALLAPFGAELDVRIEPAGATTMLGTRGRKAVRTQRILSWAGPFSGPPEVDSEVLHLAPVAAECPEGWRGPAGFVGLTPQGIVRRWGADGVVESRTAPARYLPLAERCDAAVVNERERADCSPLLDRVSAAGGLVSVTAEGGTNVLDSAGRELRVEVPPVACVVDDLGAGDVYAAAFFSELAAGADAESAASFAIAAAGLRMAAPGAGAIATRARIERRRDGSDRR